jgi:hypothetical protein
MSNDMILYILALIAFLADTLNVPVGIKWFSLGVSFLVLSLII